MKVLVINSGSSSLKYQFIHAESQELITKGLIEKIGGDSQYSYINHEGSKVRSNVEAENHNKALELVIDNLKDPKHEFIRSLSDIEAIGHRVVHGGEEFSGSVRIDDKVIKSIDKYSELAPLHNPPNLQGILACKEILPETPQVAVFDTAFHQSMPKRNYLYALPYEYYEKYRIRRYGFHGTSHHYVAMKAAEYLHKPLDRCNFITCHLGNGSSITAIKGGKSYDTSMGFTPLEGVVMGTRCGTVDPAIVAYLMEKEGLSTDEIDTILNKKSGLLGLSGISNDLRAIWDEAKEGNEHAKTVRQVLVRSIRHYIGSYLVDLGWVDAIIFTAGIGENDWEIREMCMQGLEKFNLKVDPRKNRAIGEGVSDISTDDTPANILLVPTNEELMIALETRKVLNG